MCNLVAVIIETFKLQCLHICNSVVWFKNILQHVLKLEKTASQNTVFLFCFHLIPIFLHVPQWLTLKYFYTVSSGVPNFPGFVCVGLIDVQMFHSGSDTRREEPRQDWMDKVTYDDQQCEKETDGFIFTQQVFKVNTQVEKQCFNQTVHIELIKLMYTHCAFSLPPMHQLHYCFHIGLTGGFS